MEPPVLERIRSLGRQSFVELIAEVYKGEGYLVEQTGGERANGGHDLVLLRENASVLVQCRHWLVGQVGVPPLCALGGAMEKGGPTGGAVVSTGGFYQPVQKLPIR